MPLNKVKAEKIEVGDTIQVEGWPKPASVRKITLVLHMDNNMDLTVAPNEVMWKVIGT